MDFMVGESFELTDAIKLNVQESINKVRTLLHKEAPITVFLDKVSPRIFSVRFSMRYGQHDFFAEENDHDFYKALDLARDRMIRQVKDFKEKMVRTRNDPSQRSAYATNEIANESES